jgi:TonB family protein
MPLLQDDRRAEIGQVPLEATEPRQRRQMLIALALLLLALILVLVKDRHFWFPSAPVTDSSLEDQTAPDAEAPSQSTSAASQTSSSPAKAKARTQTPAPADSNPVAALSPMVTNRAVLPPLEVEVVAGDRRQTIRPGNPSVHVDLQPGAPTIAAGASVSGRAPVGGDSGATSAAERVKLSASTAGVVTHSVEPDYPLLARQMKVQGSVVLQALIGKEGNIQGLQVLSGPAILSTAAREAVKQWRFRPYLQSGQPVETEARITVNFTISTQ